MSITHQYTRKAVSFVIPAPQPPSHTLNALFFKMALGYYAPKEEHN